MKIVGLTGGIGSGKTTIAKYFESLGVPIYIADKEAKALMNRSKVIKRKLTMLFGDAAYSNGELNKPYLASKIFNNRELLQKMNAIVHPKVASHFKRWLKKQDAAYIIKEVAIIFENNLQEQYDLVITVVADKDKRIERVLNRDRSTVEKIEAIIKNQLLDEEKSKRSDFVITNNNLDSAKQQALEIHETISEK
ncbi:MAG: dephospho-CoA kinase [Winogradskyella sp.]|uniref:dephospho-CoA kinase n=1 Tax=Winogradskyella sp. TaxID=1883156 RepID=UPI0017B28151|nr:dephospho-CoA kinase [Winogradskyella sp.]